MNCKKHQVSKNQYSQHGCHCHIYWGNTFHILAQHLVTLTVGRRALLSNVSAPSMVFLSFVYLAPLILLHRTPQIGFSSKHRWINTLF